MPFRAIFQSGLVYGLVAFVAGFLFGALRETVLIPAFGSRMGHLIEFPLVTAAICAAGALIARRSGLTVPAAGLMGLAGTLVLVIIESGFALGLMGRPLDDYLAAYDLTRGSLFPVGLALMALAPPFGTALLRR